MKRFEQETNKRAIWKGKITENFKNWLEGKKIYDYDSDKERWTAYISSEINNKWENFLKEHNYNKSKLIRDSINFFIDRTVQLEILGNNCDYRSVDKLTRESINHYLDKTRISNPEISNDLKQSLTAIKGFIQLALEFCLKDEKEKAIRFINDAKTSSDDLELKIKRYYEAPPLAKRIQPKYNILYIEDDLPTINIITEHLKKYGYTVKGAQTAREGMEELKIFTPELILVDIGLPDIPGDTLCKQLKSSNKYKDIPIVFITAVPENELVKIKEETKVDEVIPKPFEFEELNVMFKYLKKQE